MKILKNQFKAVILSGFTSSLISMCLSWSHWSVNHPYVSIEEPIQKTENCLTAAFAAGKLATNKSKKKDKFKDKTDK